MRIAQVGRHVVCAVVKQLFTAHIALVRDLEVGAEQMALAAMRTTQLHAVPDAWPTFRVSGADEASVTGICLSPTALRTVTSRWALHATFDR